MSQFFTWGDQSIGSLLLINTSYGKKEGGGGREGGKEEEEEEGNVQNRAPMQWVKNGSERDLSREDLK